MHRQLVTTTSVLAPRHIRIADPETTDPRIEEPELMTLARRLAELVPAPSADLLEDPAVRESFAAFVDAVVDGLVVAADHDSRLLWSLVGPPMRVGVNPPWRILLERAAERAAEYGAGWTLSTC